MKRALLLLSLMLTATQGYTQSGGGYDASWGVIAGGGITVSTGRNYSLGSTIGQPVAIGEVPLRTGSNFELTDGFWFVRYALLSGSVTLQDFRGDVATVPVELHVREAGGRTPLQVYTLSLNASGGYSLVAPLDGIYDLSAKASHWLRHTRLGVSVLGAVTVNFSLVNGDIDGDNEVTLFDFGALVAAFGSLPGDENWNPNADLDGDEEVTLFDFGILVHNFGAVGDE